MGQRSLKGLSIELYLPPPLIFNLFQQQNRIIAQQDLCVKPLIRHVIKFIFHTQKTGGSGVDKYPLNVREVLGLHNTASY